MFGWFNKKRQNRAPTIDVAALSDDQLAGLINQMLEMQDETFYAFLLVAYSNYSIMFSMFVSATKLEKAAWPQTDEGMAGWCESALSDIDRSSLEGIGREVAQRRLSCFFIATLLKVLHSRARAADSEALWGRVADIWVILLPGARALRNTLDSTHLWTVDKDSFFALHYFDDVVDEDSGEKLCLTFLMPERIRFHPAIKRWQERNLSPEELAELRKFDEVPFEDLFK